MDWKSLFLGGGDDLLSEFNAGEIVMLLPKLLCSIWRAINALIIRGIWVGAAEMVISAVATPFGGAPAEVTGVVRLLAWLALLLIVLVKDERKWIKVVVVTVITETLLELVINIITGLVTGTAWAIPGIAGAFVLVISAVAEAAINAAVSKEKK